MAALNLSAGSDLMTNLNFKPSTAPLRTVQEIQFGLLAPDEIKAMSVVSVEYPETTEEDKTTPREKGLSDPKMGTIDSSKKCATCGEGERDCPGHFGHIELAVPVFHVGFISKIKKILETVCHNCGKILLDERDQKFLDAKKSRDPKRRFDAIHSVCKGKGVCEMDEAPTGGDDERDVLKEPGHGGCGNVQPTIRKEGLKLMGTWKPPKGDDDEARAPEKKQITPQMALDVFRLITAEDITVMGLSNDYARPEWMLITVLPVPPPQVRPSVANTGSGNAKRAEDDLTYKLGDIVRANANVRRCESEGSPQHVKTEFESLLQFHVATYMDNNIAGLPQALQKSGRAVKSIRARLKGKEGRLRGNLMGKRVDFSARTVITGDPNISLDQVGVPESIATTLTFPERVTPLNFKQLSDAVANGPEMHPGARFVIRGDGLRYDLKRTKTPPTLQYGWKVERHIRNEDLIVFNRQPSLHKESMMGHRVLILPYSTFRLNLSVTSPYNADFDGDEMNLHVPQSHETRAEVRELCAVPKNIVSPQKGTPLMGIVQDSLCGIYKLCRRDTLMSYDQITNILMWVPEWDGVVPPPAIFKPRPRWTGKQLISMALPPGLNLVTTPGKGGHMSPIDDSGLFISNSELMFGLFNKKIVGAAGGGIVHVCVVENGQKAAVKFFDSAQRIVAYWLLHNGFSIGIGDTIPDPETKKGIAEAADTQKKAVEEITLSATQDRLEPQPGMNIRQTFESSVAKCLNTARDDAGSRTENSLKDINNAVQMARSGSKGSSINISQMTALVGQQMVEGKRIPFGFKYRTLPHFTKDDYSPASRGFVENSYLTGLTPSEFFFHAMAGREGLIDTAVKTAETGYIQRRLVKALEDVMARYDGTVRNSLGDIVEFVYGEDGLDAVNIESQKVPFIGAPDSVYDDMVKVDILDSAGPLRRSLELYGEIAGDAGIQGLLDEEYAQLKHDRDFMRDNRLKRIGGEFLEVFLPVNIARLITISKTNFKIRDGTKSDLHPAYVINEVRNLTSSLMAIRGDDPLSVEAQDSATMMIKAHVRTSLAFKRVACEYSLNRIAFDSVISEIKSRFERSAVSAGEMVGVLAAQSIGEPATQMTLNTFHFAGVSSKNVTLGVPRLKEILNVAANIKTPSMTVFQADPNDRFDMNAAHRLRSRVEHTTLRSVSETVEIYYDPDIQGTVVPADRDMVEAFFIIPDQTEEELAMQSKWLLRIVLSRRALIDKDLTPKDIAERIQEQYHNDLAVIFSDDNAEAPVIRIRVNKVDPSKDELPDDDEIGSLQRTQEYMLDTLTLGGVPGIERVFLNTRTIPRIDERGAVIALNADPKCVEHVLDTTGSSFARVLELPEVDAKRTTTNAFVEIMHVLGIEACRTALMKELYAVLSFDSSTVNMRHMSLLCNVMTARGHLMAITRHGINRADTGALMRCSFEETVEILLEAAATGELDDCRGVSENIMLGQLAPLGTGEFEVYTDQSLLDTIAADPSRLADGVGALGEEGAATPYDMGSPMQEGGFGSPDYQASFSPIHTSNDGGMGGGLSAYGGADSGYDSAGGYSPWGGATSPAYAAGATSPFSSGISPSSPRFSPASPGYSPSSPSMAISSPGFTAASPAFGTPTSPLARTPSSPAYSPASPAFNQHISPASPRYSPTSPNYSPTSPNYSPTSPTYSPTSPAGPGAGPAASYSPASPAYSPTSPKYSPTSPAQQASPSSPKYSPTSPAGGSYSPTSPRMSPTSPANPSYSPTSPKWSPASPRYSPT